MPASAHTVLSLGRQTCMHFIDKVSIIKETEMSKLPMRYRLRFAFQRCVELLEVQLRETQDREDVCDCGGEDCSYPNHYDYRLPFKHMDAAVSFFMIDTWFADNDNIDDDGTKRNVVDLLKYCSGYASSNNPIMKAMFDGLVTDLQDNSEEPTADATTKRKRELH